MKSILKVAAIAAVFATSTASAEFWGDDSNTNWYNDGSGYGYGDGSGRGRGSGEFNMNFSGKADADTDWRGDSGMYGSGGVRRTASSAVAERPLSGIRKHRPQSNFRHRRSLILCFDEGPQFSKALFDFGFIDS